MTPEIALSSAVELARRWQDTASAEEVVLVGNLLQAYALFTDAGAGDDLARLFTADASWDGTALGYGVANGRSEIAKLVLSHHDADRPSVHLPGPPLVVRVDTGFEVFSWTVATRLSQGVTKPLIFFSYHDALCLEDGSLRFRSRRLELLLPAPS